MSISIQLQLLADVDSIVERKTLRSKHSFTASGAFFCQKKFSYCQIKLLMQREITFKSMGGRVGGRYQQYARPFIITFEGFEYSMNLDLELVRATY